MSTRTTTSKLLIAALLIGCQLVPATQFVAAAAPSTNEGIQQKVVTGTVKDEKGEPIIGAGVLEKGTSNGTITDVDGNFSISVAAGKTLVVSSIGYMDAEVVAGTAPIAVILKEDKELLDEVVVIGYGTVKKRDLTGSVSSFRKKDMSTGSNASLSALLEGRAAGVRVTQSSAEPGGGIDVSIRGAGSVNASSSPLYVIDGLPIETNNVVSGQGASVPGVSAARNPLASINPSDIESIEVLKDASATAIYGARGANGVILVTTKKGSQGRMKVTYDGYAGVQLPKNLIEVLNAEDYKRVLNDLRKAPGTAYAGEDEITSIQDGGTDWQRELIRTAYMQSHSLSLSGGNKDSKVYSSINYLNQPGVLKTSAYERLDGRVNAEHTGKNFKMGANMTTSYSKDNQVPLGFNTNEEGGVLYAARNFDPTYSIYDAKGAYQRSDYLNVENPFALLYGKTSQTLNYRTLGSLYGELTILPGWTVKANVGADVRTSRRDTYVSKLCKDGRAKGGVANIFTGTRSNYLGELTTTYMRDLKNNSSLNIMAGVTYQKFVYMSMNATGMGFPSDDLTTNNMSLADSSLYSVGSSKENNKLLSYIGRANYNLMDKYLLTATLRVDGSSRFGTNNKFGYFPSAAFAWKAINEDFVKNLNVFDDLKLRVSYGRTGNQDIGNYMSITTFQSGGSIDLNQNQVVTFQPSRLANPDLKWETTSQFNIGLDMGFLNNRIYATLEYFYKYTSDMLFNRPLAGSTGYTQRLENVGDMSNRGLELTVNTHNIEGKFIWNTSFNLGTLKNRVENLNGIPDLIHVGAGQTTNNIAIIREGETINSFYGWQTDGIWQSQEEIDAAGMTGNIKPGDIKFVDQDGSKTIDAKDRVILGNSMPKVTMGLGNEFSYKGFTLNVFFDAALGFKILNNSVVESYYPVSFRRNRIAELYLNRWTPENPTNKYPSFANPTAQGTFAVNDRTVESGSYVRLQTLQLSYNVPLKENKYVSGLTIYANGQNLATFTKYSGQDPAFNANNSSTLRIDFNSYPTYRTFTLGMNRSF